MDATTRTRQIAAEYVDSLEQRDWPRLTALLADPRMLLLRDTSAATTEIHPSWINAGFDGR
jgi:hypothetical protein